MAPGILYVTMSPHTSLPIEQFHDWYNNEHGPLRLRLPFCTSGFRYRATDLFSEPTSASKPEWMAIYDITDMAEMTREPYTKLREPGVKTQRETDTRAQVDVGRFFFDRVGEWKHESFEPVESLSSPPPSSSSSSNNPSSSPASSGNVMVAVNLLIKPPHADSVRSWYFDEHVSMLSKVPGWRRSRLFVSSSICPTGARGRSPRDGETEFIALHDYRPDNGLGGKEFQAAIDTEWACRVLGRGGTKAEDAYASEMNRRVWGLHYVFGPAPRDIGTLAGGNVLAEWRYSTPRSVRTQAGSGEKPASVESYITTRDGVSIEFRMEGKGGGDESPVLLLSNSILVGARIWDGLVAAFLGDERFKDWRVLRYNTRGRYKDTGKEQVTLDLLTRDIVDLLDALRIRKADGAVGVSLGGATVMNLALKYPERVGAFVSCDTNASAPPTNPQAWEERIQMAEKQNAPDDMVGSDLADATVKRWFPESSFADQTIRGKIENVRNVVAKNSLQGFRNAVKALYDYNVESELQGCKVKGAFLAGDKDGKLPETMQKMAEQLGGGTELKLISNAGHLPMIDNPGEVASFVKAFLSR